MGRGVKCRGYLPPFSSERCQLLVFRQLGEAGQNLCLWSGLLTLQLYFVMAVLGLSSLLNIYYLLEPLSRGFFREKEKM